MRTRKKNARILSSVNAALESNTPLVWKFNAAYETRNFIAVFTGACHWSVTYPPLSPHSHTIFIQILLNIIFSLHCIWLPFLFASVISAFLSFSATRHRRGVKRAFRMIISALAQMDCQSVGGVAFIYAVCLPFDDAYNSPQLFGIECTDEVRGVLTSGHSGLNKDALC
jgi:hypothetical protein